jgi:hypothetical protein
VRFTLLSEGIARPRLTRIGAQKSCDVGIE